LAFIVSPRRGRDRFFKRSGEKSERGLIAKSFFATSKKSNLRPRLTLEKPYDSKILKLEILEILKIGFSDDHIVFYLRVDAVRHPIQ
jgi:hypothetical protein